MEFFVPVQPASFSVNPVTPSQKSADAIQHNLLPNQVVQATIAEKGDGRVLLEMGGKQMWAQSKAEVKTGQQLNLQVTSTEPRLQLQVVPKGTEQHLLRLLHLFDHKPEIGARLQQMGTQVGEKNSAQQLQQLAQQFLGQRPVPQGTDLTRAAAPLQEVLAQLQNVNQNVRRDITGLLQQLPTQATQAGSQPLSQHISQPFTQLLNNLVSVLQNPNASGAGTSPTLSAQAEQVLAPLLQTAAGTKPSPEGLQQLQTLLTQLAKFSPASAATPGSGFTPTGKETDHVQALAASLLQSLAQSVGNMQQNMATPPPRELALLAQVLGLNFEGRLLNGDIEQARSSLKGMLLNLKGKEDTPAQLRENSTNLLQQLELFQLCRGRLAQDGILFLPLPYDFLQQGYALIEEYGDEQGAEGEQKEKNLSVTLNLALNNLGAMNIHLLFEQKKLFVRISCADPQTTALVENTRAQLDTILQPLGLQRLNVDANGQDPAVALIGLLSPDKSVLDARV
ncbi:MAG: flagellar hook-length control protein FliK [Thermodesulfobacteriota bacterium]